MLAISKEILQDSKSPINASCHNSGIDKQSKFPKEQKSGYNKMRENKLVLKSLKLS